MAVIILAGLFNWGIVKSIMTYAEYEEYAAEYNVYFRWMDENNHETMEDVNKVIRVVPEGVDTTSPIYGGENYSNAEYENRTENIFAEFTIDSPNILNAGECTFTISGLYDLKRGGGLKLDTKDEALINDWDVVYDEDNDVYTFTNRNPLNKDYSTTFHWYADARDCVDGFTKELETSCKVTHKLYTTVETVCYVKEDGTYLVDDNNAPIVFATPAEAIAAGASVDGEGNPIEMQYTYSKAETINNVPLNTNNLNLEFYSRPDEFTLRINGNVLDAKDYEKLSDEYTWFEYTSVINRTEYARGLEKSMYEISVKLPEDFVQKIKDNLGSGYSKDKIKEYLQVLDRTDEIMNGDVEVVEKDGNIYVKFTEFEKFGGFENTTGFKIGLKKDILNSIGEDLNDPKNRLHVYGHFDGQLYDQRANEDPDMYAEAEEKVFYSGSTDTSVSGRTPTPYNYGDHGYERYIAPKLAKSSSFEKSDHSKPDDTSKLMLANALFGGTGRSMSFVLKPTVTGTFSKSVPTASDGMALTPVTVDGDSSDDVKALKIFAEGDEDPEDFKYELIVGDDALAIYQTDKTARLLDESEYNFTHITIPQLLNKKSSENGEYLGYNYDVYIKEVGKTDYEIYGSGNTQNVSDIYFSKKVKAVCVRVHEVETGIEDFNIKVDVNVKMDNDVNVENIEADNGKAIDTENRLVNYGFIQMLKPEVQTDGNGDPVMSDGKPVYKKDDGSGNYIYGNDDYAAVKNESDKMNSLYSNGSTSGTYIGHNAGEVSADAAVYAQNGLVEISNPALLKRVYANVWLRNAMTTVASNTEMTAFKFIPKGAADETGAIQVVPIHKTKVTSTGTILSESPGALYKFRMYAVIPDNLQLTDETLKDVTLDFSAVQQGSGEAINNSYLKSSPYVYTLRLTNLNGQQVIEADFHFKAALKMDSETKVTIKYDAFITGEELSKLGTSERLFTASTYMLVLDSGVEVKNADNKPALVNLAVDGGQKEAALSTDQKRINLADKQRSVQSSKYVTTYLHPNGSIASRVEGKNINEPNSMYSYHLSFTDYINVTTATAMIHDPIMLDIVEYDPSKTSVEGMWQGTLVSVDATSVAAQGFAPQVYYKIVEKGSAELTHIKQIVVDFANDQTAESVHIQKYDDFENEVQNGGSWVRMNESSVGSNIFVPATDSLPAGYVYVVAAVLTVPDDGNTVNKEHTETIDGVSKTYRYMPVTSTDHTITMDVVLNMQAPEINNGTQEEMENLTEDQRKERVNNNQYAKNDFSSMVIDSSIRGDGTFSTTQFSYVDSNPTELYLSHLVRLVKVEKNDHTRRLEGAEFSVFYDENCHNSVWWWVNHGSTSTLETMEQISDVRGYVEFSLAPGTYYLKETKAPKGYLLDNTIYKIEVPENNSEVTLHKPNGSGYEDITADIYSADESGLFMENERIENIKVRFVKKDADAKVDTFLNGAKYSVYKVEDTISDTPVSFVYQESMKNGLQGCYVYTTPEEPYDQNESGDSYSNSPVSLLETGKNKNVNGKISSTETALVGKDGSIWLANLPDGLYIIREISAPTGYDVNSDDFYFRVVPSRMTTPPSDSTVNDVKSDVYNKLGWIMFADNDAPITSGGESSGDEGSGNEGSGNEGSSESTETSAETNGETEKSLYDKQKKSILRIKKTAYSSSSPFGGAALKGANYILLKLKDEYEGNVQTALDKLLDAVYSNKKYTDAVDSNSIPYWKAVTSRARTGNDGIATVSDISFGYYVFLETIAPRGYNTNIRYYGAMDSDAQIVNIGTANIENLKDGDNITVAKKVVDNPKTGEDDVYSIYCYHVTPAIAEKYEGKEPYTVYQADEKKTGQARVEKTDDFSGLELNKAYYQLYKQIVSPDTGANAPNTKTDSLLSVKNYSELGSYYAGLDAANPPVPVSEVLETKDIDAEKGVTELVKGLEWGDNIWYYFVEVRAPKGYTKNEFTYTPAEGPAEKMPIRRYFRVTEETADILIKVYDSDERESGKIELTKTGQNDPSANMQGARFKIITKDESKTVQNVVKTDENGVHQATDADNTHWYVCSVKNGEGHYIDANGVDIQTFVQNEAEVGSDNKMRVINIPWGAYSLVETQAPAGYGKADDITFIVNGKNAGVLQELECEDPKATAEVTLTKRIPKTSADVFDAFGDPMFTFKITECDSSGNITPGGKSYVTNISFNASSETEGDKFTGSKTIRVDVNKYYIIEEVTVSRYGIDDVTAKHSQYSDDGAGGRSCDMVDIAVTDNKVLCNLYADPLHIDDTPKVSAVYDNSIKRYDMLNHTSGVNNSFTAPPKVTGFIVDYPYTIPVDRVSKKYTLSYEQIEALLSYSTSNEGESEQRLTAEQIKNDLTFSPSLNGLTVTKGDDGVVVDYSAYVAENSLNEMFGMSDMIPVSYTYNSKTYNTNMAIFFNTKSPDIKKDVIFYADDNSPNFYYFETSSGIKRTSKSFTYSIDPGYVDIDDVTAVTISPGEDVAQCDYGFRLTTNGAGAPVFSHWELLTNSPSNGGVPVKYTDGTPVVFKGTKEEIIAKVRHFIGEGTAPAAGKTIAYETAGISSPLDPEAREFHFRAVPKSGPSALFLSSVPNQYDGASDTLNARLKYLVNNSSANLLSIQRVEASDGAAVTEGVNCYRKTYLSVSNSESKNSLYPTIIWAYSVKTGSNYNVFYYTEDDSDPVFAGDQTSSFSGFSNLTVIEGMNDWVTDDTEHNADDKYALNSINALFNNTKIASFDLSNWKTSHITDFRNAFNVNADFTLNLSNWDITGSSTDNNHLLVPDSATGGNRLVFGNMIGSNAKSKLNTTVDLSNWVLPSSVTSLSKTFEATMKFTEINLSGWNTSNVKSMENMFTSGSSRAAVKKCNTDNWDFAGITLSTTDGTATQGKIYAYTNIAADPTTLSGNPTDDQKRKYYNAMSMCTWKNVPQYMNTGGNKNECNLAGGDSNIAVSYSLLSNGSPTGKVMKIQNKYNNNTNTNGVVIAYNVDP